MNTADSDLSRAKTPWLVLGIVAASLAICLLDFANYLSYRNSDFQPKLVYFLLAPACFAILLFYPNFSIRRARMGFLLFFAVYLSVNLIHAFLFQWPLDSKGAELALFRIQIFAISIVIAWAATTLSGKTIAKVALACGIVISLSIFLDFLSPSLLYPSNAPGAVPGRAAGFLVNSNRAGEALIIATLLALPALSPKRALWLLLFVGLAILLTVSRGSMLVWLVLFVSLWLVGVLPRSAILVLVGVLVIFVVSIESFVELVGQDNSAVETINLNQRLGFPSSDTGRDASAQERLLVLSEGVRLFLKNPLFGSGAGATHEWQFPVAPHNQLVLLAAEYGVLGSLGWLAIVILCASGNYFSSRGLQYTAAAVFVLFSMLTHNVFDFPFWLIGIALISSNIGFNADDMVD